MRLWHILCAVAVVALALALLRDPVSRTMLIVLATGGGEVAFSLIAVVTLFRTIGAIGEARSLLSHADALASTAVVLAVSSAVMAGWLFCGFWLVARFV